MVTFVQNYPFSNTLSSCHRIRHVCHQDLMAVKYIGAGRSNCQQQLKVVANTIGPQYLA